MVDIIAEPLKDGKADLGFYISFGDESPKWGKPLHLRAAAVAASSNAAQLPTKKNSAITLDRLMASTSAGMGTHSDNEDRERERERAAAGAPLSIKNLRAAEVNPSTASLGRVKPAVPPKNKFLPSSSSSAKKPSPPQDQFTNRHHRAVSPQSSSGTVSSSADVDSNAPIEEMYALARKYEKLADPDFMRRCKADSEGLASNAGDNPFADDVDAVDRRSGWASPRSGGSAGVALVLGDETARVDPVSTFPLIFKLGYI